ncbi:hypothetical protein ZWY2020_046111 [Hordeum vulgare]|nr:hypothetical protein ZWY2020_046111 [Hordeum vulgare]
MLYLSCKQIYMNCTTLIRNPSSPRHFCMKMDEGLNAVYTQGSVTDSYIKPLKVRVVRPDTFEELMDYYITCGAFVNQYKAMFTPTIELLLVMS